MKSKEEIASNTEYVTKLTYFRKRLFSWFYEDDEQFTPVRTRYVVGKNEYRFPLDIGDADTNIFDAIIIENDPTGNKPINITYTWRRPTLAGHDDFGREDYIANQDVPYRFPVGRDYIFIEQINKSTVPPAELSENIRE